MNRSILITMAMLLTLGNQIVSAGTISDTYTAGDTLTAAKMNNIKTAVNDNDSSKQDRVTGTCVAGQSIRVINSNGTVDCEVDTDTNTTYSAGTGLDLVGTTFTPDSGTVSISSRAFVSMSSGCTFTHTSSYSYFSAGGNCDAAGSVQLPQNATVTRVTCTVYDNNPAVGAGIDRIWLIYQTLPSGGRVTPGGQATDTVDSTSNFEMSSATISHPVNNVNRTYWIEALFGTTGTPVNGGTTVRLYGCQVDYTF